MKVLQWFFLASLGIGLLEVLSYVAIPAIGSRLNIDLRPRSERYEEQREALKELIARQGNTLLTLDEELGWIYGADHEGDEYSSNSSTARGRREYSQHPEPGVLRIAAFGDSFIHGNEVRDSEAWSSQLELLEPALEVLNYGVGGYGTDQALLKYRRRADDLNAQIVILGFSGTNYARNLNRYRPFLSIGEQPLSKPRFTLTEDRKLRLLENPMPGIKGAARMLRDVGVLRGAGRDDFFYEPLVWESPLYDLSASMRLLGTIARRTWHSRMRSDRLWRDGMMNPDGNGVQLLEAIARTFAKEAEARGSRFLLLVFPGRESHLWTTKRSPYAPMLDALEDLTILDLRGPAEVAFEGRRDALFASGGHYSPEGNAFVAEQIRRWIKENGSPNGIL